jgi:uncharacterized Zn finger protein (UPF0148 family)
MTTPHCQGTTRQGTPCNALARSGSVWCPWHGPALAEDRATWRHQGGREKANIRRAAKRIPEDLQDVKLVLLRAIEGIEAGTFEPQRAQALSSLTRALVSLYEVSEFERRLAELEAQAAEAVPRWGT